MQNIAHTRPQLLSYTFCRQGNVLWIHDLFIRTRTGRKRRGGRGLDMANMYTFHPAPAIVVLHQLQHLMALGKLGLMETLSSVLRGVSTAPERKS